MALPQYPSTKAKGFGLDGPATLLIFVTSQARFFRIMDSGMVPSGVQSAVPSSPRTRVQLSASEWMEVSSRLR